MTIPLAPSTPSAPLAPIQISKPTASYTVGGEYLHVQFQRLSPRTGVWERHSYSPRQADLSARASVDVLALIPGYWGDDELGADVLAYLAEEFGITNAVIIDDAAQPEVPVGAVAIPAVVDAAPDTSSESVG